MWKTDGAMAERMKETAKNTNKQNRKKNTHTHRHIHTSGAVSAGEVSALQHELGDDAVEGGALEVQPAQAWRGQR